MSQLEFENFTVPEVRQSLDMVPSVFASQREMLIGIQQLYGPIYADVTYSTGQFWKELPKPVICTDLSSGDTHADFTNLPFASRSIPSMIIDPPFLVDRGKEDSYHEDSLQMTKRFTAYVDMGDLMSSYTKALYEAYRVLKSGGYLAFKCQDIVSRQKRFSAHCHVWQTALNVGFTAEDLFILVASSRITGRWDKQQHARNFASYVWIFSKRKATHAIKETDEADSSPVLL